MTRKYAITEMAPSLTKQSFKDECDINNIMKKYREDGLVSHVKQFQGHYQDLPSETDYHTLTNQLLAAEDAFASLTAEVRDRFNNSPAEFLGFVHDDNNHDELIALGLATESSLAAGPPSAEVPEAAPGGDPEGSDAPTT